MSSCCVPMCSFINRLHKTVLLRNAVKIEFNGVIKSSNSENIELLSVRN
jgi:hypothetical protein